MKKITCSRLESFCNRLIILAVLICLAMAGKSQGRIVEFNNPAITYEGRVELLSDAAALSWSGTSVTLRFSGTSVSAILRDADTANYYNVIIDDSVISRLHTDTVKTKYLLAEGLGEGNHKVQLFKRTEWAKGKTFFYGFLLPSHTAVLAPALTKRRKIEFYGNSITCGYGVEDSSGHDSGTGYFENNYLSYAAITARDFNAQYSCIARSGIGIMVSWQPLIMPEMYDRLDATDPASKWNFSLYKPDIVVINLFQNDSWIVKIPDHPEFIHRFGRQVPGKDSMIEAYRQFLKTLRKKYPSAIFICALGSMDATREGSPWPGYIREAVGKLHDKKMYTLFFPYKGTPGHPKIAEQQAMANTLEKFIQEKIKW